MNDLSIKPKVMPPIYAIIITEDNKRKFFNGSIYKNTYQRQTMIRVYSSYSRALKIMETYKNDLEERRDYKDYRGEYIYRRGITKFEVIEYISAEDLI